VSHDPLVGLPVGQGVQPLDVLLGLALLHKGHVAMDVAVGAAAARGHHPYTVVHNSPIRRGWKRESHLLAGTDASF